MEDHKDQRYHTSIITRAHGVGLVQIDAHDLWRETTACLMTLVSTGKVLRRE